MSLKEAAILDGFNAEFAGFSGGPVEVSREPSLNGQCYTIGFGTTMLSPESFFKVLYDTAPNPRDDKAGIDGIDDDPSGVIDDWAEPDQDNQDARVRIKRHERLLGKDWSDFMLSRTTFMDILGEIPKIENNENEVRPLTEVGERAKFAAAYIVGGRNRPTITGILERTGLDEKIVANLYSALDRFMPVNRIDGIPKVPFPAVRMTEKKFVERLLCLPTNVTDQIIHSTLPLELESDASYSPANSAANPCYRYYPGNSFINRFCVQGVRTPEDTIMAVPYAYSSFPLRRHSWYIPSRSKFSHRERKNATCTSAIAINPGNGIDSTSGDPVHAVLFGSFKSKDTVKVLPQIRWYRLDDGTHNFDISIGTSQSDRDRVVRSGIFGIILAATVQPDIRAHWPKTITDSEYGAEQRMGVAQLPVLALKTRRQLARSPLITMAEMAID